MATVELAWVTASIAAVNAAERLSCSQVATRASSRTSGVPAVTFQARVRKVARARAKAIQPAIARARGARLGGLVGLIPRLERPRGPGFAARARAAPGPGPPSRPPGRGSP